MEFFASTVETNECGDLVQVPVGSRITVMSSKLHSNCLFDWHSPKQQRYKIDCKYWLLDT